jgi:hypothetical protein
MGHGKILHFHVDGFKECFDLGFCWDDLIIFELLFDLVKCAKDSL